MKRPPFNDGDLVQLKLVEGYSLPRDKSLEQLVEIRREWASTGSKEYTDVIGTHAIATNVRLGGTEWVFKPVLFTGKHHAIDYASHWELVRKKDSHA